MSAKYDVIVIGGGHNGLIHAAYLAKAGKKVLVLERRHVLGGAAVTEEVFPGFKFSVCSYVVSLLRPEIIRDLDLPRHGLEILPLDGTFTPMLSGDYLWRVNDHGKTRREIARHSKLDADAYDEYGKAMADMGRFVKPILGMTPPDPTRLTLKGLQDLLFLGKRFQQLSGEDKYNQVQLMTMSAVDFLDQWFETDVLKATMSASGIIGTFLGVRSPGTAYVLLHHYMGEIDGAFRSWGFARGGTGAISNAIGDAAREAGVEIRTKAPIAKIKLVNGKAKGVVLENGDEIDATVVSSSVDPRLTFMKMIGESELPGDFVEDIQRYKFRGSSGKVNLALDALPDFKSIPGPGGAPAGGHFDLPVGRVHGARLRRREVRALLAPALHRHGHPDAHGSLARPARQARPVLLRAVRALQAEGLGLGHGEGEVRRHGGGHDRRARAQHQEHHQAPPGGHAARPRAGVGPVGGQHLPGRAFARAALLPAAGPGLGAVPHADQEPVHVRLRDASGRRHHGRQRQERGREAPRRLEARKGLTVAEKKDVVIVGGGPNGLVAACYLAKAGLKPVVLEKRDVVGGVAVTEEFAPGFKVSSVFHAAGPFLPSIVRDLGLDRHGLSFIQTEVRVFAPAPDGKSATLYGDAARTSRELEKLSAHDAKGYLSFQETLDHIGKVLAPLLTMTPPSIDDPSLSEMWGMLGVGRKFRALPRRDAFRLLRWGPMAVADLVAEFFETELLRATVAARGIYGAFAGPWSAGTSLGLILQAASDPNAAGPATFVRGGMGALTQALAAAARGFGAEIRTGATVARIATQDGAATGVVLSTGEEVAARAVVSNADPKRTLLGLVDPVDLDPDFIHKISNYRTPGVLAKVHLALSGLPEFSALRSAGAAASGALSGRIHIGPEIDYLERAYDAAKYGDFSPHPYCDVTIPTITDPSLAPAGKHVMSIAAQFAPYRLKNGDWKGKREALGDTVVDTIAAYAPNLKGLISHRQVLTPLDLEETYGLTGGNVLHGEPALDQLFTMRPLLGWAQYRTPVRGLYLCGSGTHPGGGVTGAPGANASREVQKDLRGR